jgi:hypothetical protein
MPPSRRTRGSAPPRGRPSPGPAPGGQCADRGAILQSAGRDAIGAQQSAARDAISTGGGAITNSFNSTSYSTNHFSTGPPRPRIDRDRGRLLLTSKLARLAQAGPVLTSVLGGDWLTHLSPSTGPGDATVLTGVLIGVGVVVSLILAGWCRRVRRDGFTFLLRPRNGTPRLPVLLDEWGDLRLVRMTVSCPYCGGRMRLRAVSRRIVYVICRRHPQLHRGLFDHTQLTAGVQRRR